MPRVNIYIRKEDYLKWQAIDNKSALIHAVLNGKSIKNIQVEDNEPKVVPIEPYA